MTLADGSSREAITFTASAEGCSSPYLVPRGEGRSVAATAAVILRSRGASGANIDYFRSLLACMRARGVRDAHLEAIDERIRAAGKEEEGAGAEKCEARSS